MREIPLTQGQCALVDDEDYERVAIYRWHRTKAGYVIALNPAPVGPKLLYLHRLVFGPAYRVDHRNQNKSDCRKDNLRAATPTQNNMNCGKRARNTSGYKGVYWSKSNKAWVAQINDQGKRRYIGGYPDPIEAAKAYDEVARELYGEYAGTNF